MSQKKRRSVVKPLEEAIAQIENGMTVAIGGFGADNHPMSAIREMIRQGKKELTILANATAGLEIDLLIGAGCVKKLIAPYVGQEMYCPIGHNYRKYAEEGLIDIWECSEYTLYAGLFAGASGQDFMAWRGGVGTSIPEMNKDMVEFIDPIGGKKKYLAIPALRSDWALIHVGYSDKYGNGQHMGAPFGDRWLARAADRIMTIAERIVPNAQIRRNPFMTSISYADCVVESPYGGHPYAAHAFYREDPDHIQDYVAASAANRKGDSAAWDVYLKKTVFDPTDQIDYLEKIPGLRKLIELYQHPHVTF